MKKHKNYFYYDSRFSFRCKHIKPSSGHVNIKIRWKDEKFLNILFPLLGFCFQIWRHIITIRKFILKTECIFLKNITSLSLSIYLSIYLCLYLSSFVYIQLILNIL